MTENEIYRHVMDVEKIADHLLEFSKNSAGVISHHIAQIDKAYSALKRENRLLHDYRGQSIQESTHYRQQLDYAEAITDKYRELSQQPPRTIRPAELKPGQLICIYTFDSDNGSTIGSMGIVKSYENGDLRLLKEEGVCTTDRLWEAISGDTGTHIVLLREPAKKVDTSEGTLKEKPENFTYLRAPLTPNSEEFVAKIHSNFRRHENKLLGLQEDLGHKLPAGSILGPRVQQLHAAAPGSRLVSLKPRKRRPWRKLSGGQWIREEGVMFEASSSAADIPDLEDFALIRHTEKD